MAGDGDPPLSPPYVVAPAGRGDASAARGDDGRKEEEPPVPPPDEKEQQDQLARLPDDLLANILGRLRPRWLAMSRCVCNAWRDAVDARDLLRTDLLPLSLVGIFVHFDEHKFPELFSRPSSPTGARAPTGDLSFLCPTDTPESELAYSKGWDQYAIEDHCNGLLLLRCCVFNPATRRWNILPRHPLKQVTEMSWYNEYLVFDPMVSPHYEVFMIPHLDDNDPLVEASEWPPSPFKIHVFSSRLGYWEERTFVREGVFVNLVIQEGWAESGAVYWRGALYVHCKTGFVIRISLSDNKYRVIKPPKDIRRSKNGYAFLNLVRSKKGVYLASFYKCWLQVWVLNESCGRTDWILKHDKDIKPLLARRRLDQLVPVHWILEDINYNLFLSSRSPEDITNQIVEEKFDWNSDNDIVLDNGNMLEECYWDEENCDDTSDFKMMGFHPYKEIVFITKLKETGLAYHLNSSKVECLGNMYPTRYHHFKSITNESDFLKYSFPYTPCWIKEFPL